MANEQIGILQTKLTHLQGLVNGLVSEFQEEVKDITLGDVMKELKQVSRNVNMTRSNFVTTVDLEDTSLMLMFFTAIFVLIGVYLTCAIVAQLVRKNSSIQQIIPHVHCT